MKIIRTILLVVVFAFILYVKFVTAPAGTGTTAPTVPATSPTPAATTTPAVVTVPTESTPAPQVDASVPQKALNVLQIVRSTGQPPDGYVGGRTFENREGRLPAGGDYREFDVDPHNGQRNAERLIVEWTTKKAWYTGDHYQTFIPLP